MLSKIHGKQITKKHFSALEEMTRKFLGKINYKYVKEFKDFSEKKFGEDELIRVLPFSNQNCEAVFGNLKCDQVSGNTADQQLIHQCCLKFNKTLNWALEQKNVDELFLHASSSRKQNKKNSKIVELEYDEL